MFKTPIISQHFFLGKIFLMVSQVLPDVMEYYTCLPEVKCTCRGHKCLRLYCPCFSKGTYCCNRCTCVNCENTMDRLSDNKKIRTHLLMSAEHNQHIGNKLKKLPSCTCRKKKCQCMRIYPSLPSPALPDLEISALNVTSWMTDDMLSTLTNDTSQLF